MPHHRKLRILLIDEEASHRKQLRSLLEDLRVGSIVDAKDFREISLALKDKVDVIIIGDGCLDGTASACLDFLLEHPEGRSVPCWLCSAYLCPKDVRVLVSRGLSGTIEAPPKAPGIRALLRNYTREHSTKEITSLVKQASFFSEFNKDELSAICAEGIVRIFPAGETIITKDDPSDHFFVLLQGRVEIIVAKDHDSMMHLNVEAGRSFGEMSFLDKTPRSAFCIAADDCFVLEIGSHILNDKDYSLRLKILTQIAFTLAHRIRTMNTLLPGENSTDNMLYAVDEVVNAQPQEVSTATVEPEGSLPKSITVERAPREVTDTSRATKVAEAILHETDRTVPDNDDEEEVSDEAPKNPFSVPTASSEVLDSTVRSREDYDVLTRKVNLRSDFICNKISNVLCEVIANKKSSYWIGSKLARINPHELWHPRWFTEGTARLKRALHLVVVCPRGLEAYDTCYLQLPLTHKVVGLSRTGCVGTFLGSEDAIARYFEDRPLSRAVEMDLQMPIDRIWRNEECIEYLSHTSQDIRAGSLFLVFDETDGRTTATVREHFPDTQIITVVRGLGYNPEDPSTLFNAVESKLEEDRLLVSKDAYRNFGFYLGETVFLPDFSEFFANADALKDWGYIFGTIGVIAKLGPDYSGTIWGSKGGAEGAVKAARARYGIKGAQSAHELATAINWADG